ncbi:hypothetical protein DFH09DRAFT_1073326 [Mycena vulgaris]|nr:hypothetical protein DFH09DRAFT_1073326 [Mycena vulgaris]
MSSSSDFRFRRLSEGPQSHRNFTCNLRDARRNSPSQAVIDIIIQLAALHKAFNSPPTTKFLADNLYMGCTPSDPRKSELISWTRLSAKPSKSRLPQESRCGLVRNRAQHPKREQCNFLCGPSPACAEAVEFAQARGALMCRISRATRKPNSVQRSMLPYPVRHPLSLLVVPETQAQRAVLLLLNSSIPRAKRTWRKWPSYAGSCGTARAIHRGDPPSCRRGDSDSDDAEDAEGDLQDASEVSCAILCALISTTRTAVVLLSEPIAACAQCEHGADERPGGTARTTHAVQVPTSRARSPPCLCRVRIRHAQETTSLNVSRCGVFRPDPPAHFPAPRRLPRASSATPLRLLFLYSCAQQLAVLAGKADEAHGARRPRGVLVPALCAPSSRAEPSPGLIKLGRARHKALEGPGLGPEECQAYQARQARAQIYLDNWDIRYHLQTHINIHLHKHNVFSLAMRKPGLGPGLGPEEFEARACPSRAQAQAFRPSRALNITIGEIVGLVVQSLAPLCSLVHALHKGYMAAIGGGAYLAEDERAVCSVGMTLHTNPQGPGAVGIEIDAAVAVGEVVVKDGTLSKRKTVMRFVRGCAVCRRDWLSMETQEIPNTGFAEAIIDRFNYNG